MVTFNGYKHQGHSICSRKPPSKFVIGAFFRLVMLFAVFGHFFFVYLNYFENCWGMFTFNGYKHQGHSICSRKPPSKFVIGAFFRLIDLVGFRFYVRFAVFGHFFFVYLNYFENCWEIIKDIRVCRVENHPQKFVNRSILSTSYVVQRNKKKKFQKSINNSKNTYLFENSTIHR
ncbi:hypothetical protein AGLY_018055 [Aphis glycines]|uniref:Uncharacterized protein n=1 Tax=Aphis glycines TaxID=307491 RepID=A0A6G0SV67_APHGL|nr:hypothetical protein AGLY_018055 [Aphis glycines]